MFSCSCYSLSYQNLKTANSNATIFYLHIKCSAILNGIRQYLPNSWNNVICKYIIICYKLTDSDDLFLQYYGGVHKNCLNNILHSTNDETNESNSLPIMKTYIMIQIILSHW